MAEFLTRDLKLAISEAPESSYNTLRTGASDTFLGMLTTTRDIYIPDKEKQDDSGKVGTGREFPTEQRSGYLVVPSLTIAEELNIDIAAVLLRRCLGGVASVSSDIDSLAEIGGAYDQTIIMQTNDTMAGRQLPSSTLVWSLGGADYMWGGMVVESFAVEQANSGTPTFTANIVGSGKFQELSRMYKEVVTASGGTRTLTVNAQTTGVLSWNASAATIQTALEALSNVVPGDVTVTQIGTYTNRIVFGGHFSTGALTFTVTPTALTGGTSVISAITFPAPVTQRYMLGAESYAEFTDATGLYVITGTQKLKNFSATITNNHRTDDRRPGDPRVNSFQPRQGHFTNRMNHGDRTVAAEMTVMLDDVMREWEDSFNDTIITNFKYIAKGNFLKDLATGLVESTALQSEFELKFPKSYFRSARGTDDNGDAIITISIFPVDDFVNGLVSARIRTNTLTPIA